MNFLKYFFGILLLFSSVSCGKLLFGIKGFKKVPNEFIFKKATKFGIDKSEVFVVDSNFSKLLHGKHQSRKLKDMRQPLQVRVFKGKEQMIQFIVNCKVPFKFPYLEWNAYGYFDSIPNKRFSADTVITFENQIQQIKMLGFEKKTDGIFDAKYNVFVYWTCFMNRQSKHLIQFMQQVEKKYPIGYLKIHFVNCESFYYQD